MGSKYTFIIVTVLILMTAGAAAGPLNWTSGQYVMGSSGTIGLTLDLKNSESGDFHLAISNEHNGTIWYGLWQEPTWTILETATVVGLDAFFHPQLEIRGNFPTIMYDESDTSRLHFTERIEGSWTSTEAVDEAFEAYDFKFCMDEYSLFHIIYTYVTTWGTSLRYVTNRSGEWTGEQIVFYDPEYDIRKMDIALDSERRAHFVWEDTQDNEIKYALRTGAYNYEIDTAASITECHWVELRIIDGDIPYIGFLDTPGDYIIKDAYKIGGTFYNNTAVRVTGSDLIYDVGLAAAVEEGITTSNIYFVYSTFHQLNYAYYDMGWQTEVIDEVSLAGSANVISAQWDPTRDAVGIAVRDNENSNVYFALGYIPSHPTATPTPSYTPTPTPTWSPENLTLDLGPDMNYSAGDMMEGILDVHNPGAARSADIYILLEVFGEFWFAPGWMQSLDHYSVTLSPSESREIVYLPEFTLPDPLSTGGPFYFHAAAFTPDMLEAAAIISNVDTKAFSFI